MPTSDFDVRVGSLVVKSGEPSGMHLLSLLAETGMNGVGYASFEIGAIEDPPKPGDSVSISLAGAPVFTGEVLGVRASAQSFVISAGDNLAKLAHIEIEGVYKSKTAGAIAKDILSQAGLDAGNVEDGPTFGSYVLSRGPRALRHLERLAEPSGFDVYADSKGKIHFAAPRSGGADYTVSYTKQALQIEIAAEAPTSDGVIVWGEGAGAQGENKAHWLSTDLSALRGEAKLDANGSVGEGGGSKRSLTVRDGATRAQADAKSQAQARLRWLASRLLRGFVELLGDGTLAPGGLVKIEGVPRAHALSGLVEGKVLRVRRVRHTLSTRRGFVTRVEI